MSSGRRLFRASVTADEVVRRLVKTTTRENYKRLDRLIKTPDVSSSEVKVYLALDNKPLFTRKQYRHGWNLYSHKCGGMSCDNQAFYGKEISRTTWHDASLVLLGVSVRAAALYDEFDNFQNLSYYETINRDLKSSAGLSCDREFWRCKEGFVAVDFDDASCQWFLNEASSQKALREISSLMFEDSFFGYRMPYFAICAENGD